MSDPAPPAPQAWEPLTPRGAARFANASLNRLLVVQILVALLSAAGIIWFVANSYGPVISAAIQSLPEEGAITKQRLENVPPGLLGENRFLSIGVDPEGGSAAGVGDVQIRLGTGALKVCSFFGCIEQPYPAGWMITLSRSSLEPRWGAWKPMVWGAIGVASFLSLLMAWAGFAFLYCWIPKAIAFFADRDLSWKGSWKLSAAAQLAGALFALFVIVLYTLGALDLLRFLILFLLHFAIAWIYLAIAPLCLPRNAPGQLPRKNPFA